MTNARASAAWPLALGLTVLAGAVLYAVLRGGQVIFFPEPDPTRALYDPHSGFTWRVLAAAYGAGMLAPLCSWIAHARPVGAARALRVLVVAAPCLLLVQAALFP